MQSGACDLIGIGRPAAVWPHLPKEILLNEKVEESTAVKKLTTLRLPLLLRMIPIKFIGAGADTVSSTLLSVMRVRTDMTRCTMRSRFKLLLLAGYRSHRRVIECVVEEGGSWMLQDRPRELCAMTSPQAGSRKA